MFVVAKRMPRLSIAALTAFAVWEEWLNLIVGLWLIALPWLFGFQDSDAMTIDVVIGTAVAALAAFEAWTHTLANACLSQFRTKSRDRTAIKSPAIAAVCRGVLANRLNSQGEKKRIVPKHRFTTSQSLLRDHSTMTPSRDGDVNCPAVRSL